MTELEQRAAVVAEARTWLGTPYHHQGRVRGAGVDCAMLPLCVYQSVGVVGEVTIEDYPRDWYLHRDEERYLSYVERYARRVEYPGPGDLVLFRYGRCASHGGIVIECPLIIHSYNGRGVIYDRLDQNIKLAARYMGCWSPWRAP